MAYRNQNYMTNVALKEQADKAQKDYVDPNQQAEPETIVLNKYSFVSYDDDQKTTKWGEGTVQETGITEDGYTQVKVLTNSTDQKYVNQLVYITSDAKTNGTAYPLYSDAGKTALNIYVTITKIEEETITLEQYSLVIYEKKDNQTTKWAECTAEKTGIIKNGNMELKILTADLSESLVDTYMYIDKDATEETLYQLYNNTEESISYLYGMITKL